MGRLSNFKTKTLPDGGSQLSFVDKQAVQKIYRKYTVTSRPHDYYISISKSSTKSKPFISNLHTVSIRKGYAIRRRPDISAFYHVPKCIKYELSNFIKNNYHIDLPYNDHLYKDDMVETWILNDGKYYEIIYSSHDNTTIVNQYTEDSDDLDFAKITHKDFEFHFDDYSYPDSVINEIRNIHNAFKPTT